MLGDMERKNSIFSFFIFGLLLTMLVPFAIMDAHAQIPPKDPTLTLPETSIGTNAFGDPSETHSESGDAGDLPPSAQIPGGSGPLTSNTGLMNHLTDVDMYRICITDPDSFVAATTNDFGGDGAFDTRLYLFTSSGEGVYHNDDYGADLLSQLNSNPTFSPVTPGVYNLAITPFENGAEDGGISMFTGSSEDDQNELLGSVDGWDDQGDDEGTYTIALLGVDYPSSCTAVGGTFIPIDQSALLLAGVQSISMWMIPVILAGIGIGVFVIKRRN